MDDKDRDNNDEELEANRGVLQLLRTVRKEKGRLHPTPRGRLARLRMSDMELGWLLATLSAVNDMAIDLIDSPFPEERRTHAAALRTVRAIRVQVGRQIGDELAATLENHFQKRAADRVDRESGVGDD
jgi:hypothetical protein